MSKEKIVKTFWENLYVLKKFDEMGFPNLNCFNIAIFGKQGWRFIPNLGSLHSRILKVKYFPICDFVYANEGNNPSYIWKSSS